MNMTKKSITLLFAYTISLAVCFIIAFPDILSVADGNSVLVEYAHPCLRTVVYCPLCSATNPVSPTNSETNILPPVYFIERHDPNVPCDPDDPLIIGWRRLVGVHMEYCYYTRDCILDETPRLAHRCDIIFPCVLSEDDPTSFCFEVTESETVNIATYDMKIWKPNLED